MSEQMEREGKQVLARLGEAGYEAYFVGGCVRDKLLGRPLKDIDIATSALPEQVMSLFPRTAPTGLQHGTVTVIMERHTFEVTTFRKESEYERFRKPKAVEFISDLNEDLRRRDFTINAMAIAADGRRIDPFGGAADLASKRIRAVGDPLERFHEDALRMLRGIRFACEYGFEMEPDTWDALVRHAPLLAHVAMERVYAELDKMIDGRSPDRAVELLVRSGLPRYFKQSVDWPLAYWPRCPMPIDEGMLARLSGSELRWAALFVLMNMDAASAQEAMQRLKFPGKKSERIVKLLQVNVWMNERIGGDGGNSYAQRALAHVEAGFDTVALCCVEFGKPVVRQWLTLAAWREEALSERGWLPFAERAAEWVTDVPVDSVNELAVNGTDIAAELDMRPGPWLGRLLRVLLAEVARRKLPNERTSLIREAKIRIKQVVD